MRIPKLQAIKTHLLRRLRRSSPHIRERAERESGPMKAVLLFAGRRARLRDLPMPPHGEFEVNLVGEVKGKWLTEDVQAALDGLEHDGFVRKTKWPAFMGAELSVWQATPAGVKHVDSSGAESGRPRNQAEVDEAIRKICKKHQRALRSLRVAIEAGDQSALKNARGILGRNHLSRELNCSAALISKSLPWRAIATTLGLRGRMPGARGSKMGQEVALAEKSEAEWRHLAAEQAADDAADKAKPSR